MSGASRWAISGASGFIGRALSSAALARGIAVRGLTRGRAVVPGVEQLVGDLADENAVARLVRGVDTVIHLAAYVHRHPATEAQRRECREVNVAGTARLAGAIAAESSRPLLVFMSSANVYAPSDAPLDEASPVGPRTLYGSSKLEAELVVLDAVERGAIRGCVLRPGAIFGPGAPGNLDRVIRLVRRRIIIDAIGRDPRKTLVPVANVVSACFAVADEDVTGEIYNVGGAVLTMRDIMRVISRTLGRRTLHVPVPLGPAVSAAAAVIDSVFGTSAASVLRAYGSNAILVDAKLRSLAGYTPSLDVESDLRAMVAGLRRV